MSSRDDGASLGETLIEGYASIFWSRDLNDDVTAPGAFFKSLERTGSAGVKMLHQHAVDEPVGVWDDIYEDRHGLLVRGRIFSNTPQARLTQALVEARAIDGLSIGFRTIRAGVSEDHLRCRVLREVELWEVSIVTFPMEPSARITRVERLKEAA